MLCFSSCHCTRFSHPSLPSPGRPEVTRPHVNEPQLLPQASFSTGEGSKAFPPKGSRKNGKTLFIRQAAEL
ncbi:unnamed protein product [Protopolystoma xenopodis]|uniref:Uncharacterized protein n=1 Tax=Protopolystoma xenopodis TaxID=117903 RepID=A0A3S5CL24_9PLAT|nr:unnamed protein product [Protopolystoma xenopodis]